MSRTIIEDRCQKIDITKLKPLHDYILIEEIQPTESSGGVILPKGDGTSLVFGKVLAVGEGILNPWKGGFFPLEIEPGETVLTIRYMGDMLKAGGKPYRFVHEHGIWAKVHLKSKTSTDIESIDDIEPRSSNILVRPEVEDKTKSGTLLLTEGASKDMAERLAIVEKVGPGPWFAKTGQRLATGYESGQKVLMTRYAGAEISIDGIDYRLLAAGDLKCIVEEK